ncbi:MAG: 3-oxoacyl-[acyl-carrier-protein] reductase [Deltaproteobacteria bacterium]|nr:3-oxoacyl-[acyl-carrier-protein] reductase [Candidatus Zymogenaceae bacterium]
MSLSGRVALVTGASRGIGRAVAQALAEEGVEVYINYRSQTDAAEETKKDIEARGGTAKLAPFDVSNPDEVKDGVKALLDQSGRLDILINNAGITKDNLVPLMKQSQWDEVIQTNLTGTFLLTKAAVRPMMKARFGRIVNMTSVAGQYGNPGQSNYSAAKAGIIGFTRSVARELADRNITANAVSPGLIDTDMSEGISLDIRNGIIQRIPLGRIGAPGEVADAVLFLVSDHARYITGQVIGVNGGLYM